MTHPSPPAAAIRLSALYVHPIKSTTPIALPSAWAEPRGLALDRRFVICDQQGRFVTAREEPRLLQLRTTLVHDGLILSTPNHSPIYLRYSEIRSDRREVQIWSNTLSGQLCPDTLNAWLSDYLQQPVQLIYNDADSYRVMSSDAAGQTDTADQEPILFSDGYPILLTNEASLQALRDAGPAHTEMRRFRPNLVINGAPAWAEDGWQRIAIGEVELELVKPCERCVLITRDPLSGAKDPASEPLRTLARIHRDARGRVCFGHNLRVCRPGLLELDAEVRVLA